MSPEERLEAVRVTLARFMTEDSLDWRDVLEGELASLLGVAQGDEPFTWRWAQVAAAAEQGGEW